MKRTKNQNVAEKKSPAKPKPGIKKTGEKPVSPARISLAAAAPSPAGADPNLICPICAGKISVKVAFSNIYCGYHLVPSCPGNCKWPDEYHYSLMQKITELHYEHPEIFKTDEELTEESLARARERNR